MPRRAAPPPDTRVQYKLRAATLRPMRPWPVQVIREGSSGTTRDKRFAGRAARDPHFTRPTYATTQI